MAKTPVESVPDTPADPGADEPSGAAADRRRADVRSRVLASARQNFERYGVARTRMSDVAEGAGVSRPLLYEYFANRAALVEAAINDEVERLVHELRALVPTDVPFARAVVELSVASVEAGRGDALLADLFANSEMGDLTSLLQHPSRPAHAMVLDLWQPLFDRGRAEGVLRTDLDDDALIEWVMMTHHLLVLRSDIDAERAAAMFEQFLVPALVAH